MMTRGFDNKRSLNFAAVVLGAFMTQTSPATGVATFAGDAQHTANYSSAGGAQILNRILWRAPVDTTNSITHAHYGAPLVTAANTVIVPVLISKTGFRLDVYQDSANLSGTVSSSYSLATDYVMPSHNWIPVYQPVLATIPVTGSAPITRLYFPGAGGTMLYIDNPDQKPAAQAIHRLAFYPSSNTTSFNSSVFVNTPTTADTYGNIYFGFRVQGTAPPPLSTTQSGFARIAPDGTASYILAGNAAGDTLISRDSHNAAPTLSQDQATLYVPVKSASSKEDYAYLLGLDTGNPSPGSGTGKLGAKYKVLLKDPRNSSYGAKVLDDSTASPTVAPDADGSVFFGIYANPDNGSRGFMLHFDSKLAKTYTPGGFGWDYTSGIVPASMVTGYAGTSSYLLFSKYNNYAGAGDGNGINRFALLDPTTTQVDPHSSAAGLLEMREVLSAVGPTADTRYLSNTYPYARREWCINSPAIDLITNSIFTPNEDGSIYRWDLRTNSLAQAINLGSGIGEPYVPTIIGPGGIVYTMNGGTLFALGAASTNAMSLNASVPDVRAAVKGPFTLTVQIQSVPSNASVVFTDNYTGFSTTAKTITSQLSSVNVTTNAVSSVNTSGVASILASGLSSGLHNFTATYASDQINAASSYSLGSIQIP